MNKKPINIIFLDVDGVLNCSTTKERVNCYIGIEDKKVKLLKSLVDQTNAHLVLVSTWKVWWHANQEKKNKQDVLANYLDWALAKHNLKIIDKTYEYNPHHRGEGILFYLEALKRSDIDERFHMSNRNANYRLKKLILKGFLRMDGYGKLARYFFIYER